MKKTVAAIVSGAVAAPIGWFFPTFAFAFAGVFVAIAGVRWIAARNRPQVASTASEVPAVVVRPVVRVDSVDGMLVVPVRPTSQHQHAA